MNLFKAQISPKAKLDLQDIINYYDSQRAGLGLKFYNSYKKHLKVIQRNPYFAIIYKDYRSLIIKDFPFYQIIYFVNENTIYVEAIFNAKQDPNKKP